MRETLKCKSCEKEFYDDFNLLAISSLEFCLLCANQKLDKQQIKQKWHG